ncbi:MAG TPA: TonB-dependent receptor plug domain-containing protein, partial [Acidobacteriota bacterium]|nr:TonB-dependent receptor plug domain-containing protein [Acidobacteriota bacterium]
MTIQAAFAALAFGTAGALAQTAPAAPAPSPKEEVLTLSPFVVKESQSQGYKAANSVTASRFALPIIDTPMSIQVVTEDFMKDIGSRDALESLSYVSGVTQGASPIRLEGSNAFNIRGVQTGFILRDGVTSYGINDSYNIERYEVLKGIVGMMYGDRNLGGVINAVSRKPKEKFGGEIMARTDSYDSWRVQGNITGPLNESKSLLFVLSAFAKDEGTFMDYERLRARGITGALTWRPFINTSISGEIETYSQNNTLATKLPPLQIARNARFAGDAVFWQRIGYAPVAKEFNYGGPNAYLRENNKLYAFTIDQKIAEWLNFRSYGNYAVRDQRRFNRDAAASFTTIGSSTPRSYFDFATGTVRTETED